MRAYLLYCDTREVSMSLILPEDIPVAAESLTALRRIGTPRMLRSKADALVLITKDPSDPCIVWASPKLKTYRSIWDTAAARGFVDAATEWGDNVDIDHVFPKSWANLSSSNLKFVRLFPVWAEINRSAGAGREKDAVPTKNSVSIEIVAFMEPRPLIFPNHVHSAFLSARLLPIPCRSASRNSCPPPSAIDLRAFQPRS